MILDCKGWPLAESNVVYLTKAVDVLPKGCPRLGYISEILPDGVTVRIFGRQNAMVSCEGELVDRVT